VLKIYEAIFLTKEYFIKDVTTFEEGGQGFCDSCLQLSAWERG
jgi:hypothetical protein